MTSVISPELNGTSEIMIKRAWELFSNHGIVLFYIAKHPRSTTQEIAKETLLSIWGVQQIISDLEKGGYIEKQKKGRSNQYTVNHQSPLRHRLMRNYTVGEVLRSIGCKPENVRKLTAETGDISQRYGRVQV
jgi:DNA-binding IscR family transcriptional regulator